MREYIHEGVADKIDSFFMRGYKSMQRHMHPFMGPVVRGARAMAYSKKLKGARQALRRVPDPKAKMHIMRNINKLARKRNVYRAATLASMFRFIPAVAASGPLAGGGPAAFGGSVLANRVLSSHRAVRMSKNMARGILNTVKGMRYYR